MAKPDHLIGYNTNIRHLGKLYHVQTEDSGVERPHIITHVFADGGRVIASRKTTYGEHLGKDNYAEIVKRLMQKQHKELLVALRDGVFDGEDDSKEIDLDSSEELPLENGAKMSGERESLEDISADRITEEDLKSSEMDLDTEENKEGFYLFGQFISFEKSLDQELLEKLNN